MPPHDLLYICFTAVRHRGAADLRPRQAAPGPRQLALLGALDRHVRRLGAAARWGAWKISSYAILIVVRDCYRRGGDEMRDYSVDHLPDTMTEPCSRFFQAHEQLGWFHASVAQMSIFLAHLYLREAEGAMRKAWDLRRTPGVSQSQHDEAIGLAESYQAQSRKAHDVHEVSEQMLLQIRISRGVDNFLSYVSELVALTLRANRHLLRGAVTADVEENPGYSGLEDEIGQRIEKLVHRLSYKGLGALQHELHKRIDLDLFVRDEDLQRAKQLNEVRNLIVHKRAVVDRVFLERLPGYPASQGQVLQFDGGITEGDLAFLSASVRDIDARAAAKFGLGRPVSAEWFYEQVKVPQFIGPWEETLSEDDGDPPPAPDAPPSPVSSPDP